MPDGTEPEVLREDGDGSILVRKVGDPSAEGWAKSYNLVKAPPSYKGSPVPTDESSYEQECDVGSTKRLKAFTEVL